MDEAQIQQIIELLEQAAGEAEGKSRLSWPDDLACLTANQPGLLRLACTLLRAAREPILADGCGVILAILIAIFSIGIVAIWEFIIGR